MKKKLAVLLLAAFLLAMCMAIFCACADEEPEPREVELELINPITDDVIKNGDTIDLPKVKMYMEVRIKDKETGKYVTDDDLPENTINSSYTLIFYAYKDDHEQQDSWNPYGYWPTIDFMKEWSRNRADYYEVKISFDCKPRNLVDPKFVRQYKTTTKYVRFYINKPWND